MSRQRTKAPPAPAAAPARSTRDKPDAVAAAERFVPQAEEPSFLLRDAEAESPRRERLAGEGLDAPKQPDAPQPDSTGWRFDASKQSGGWSNDAHDVDARLSDGAAFTYTNKRSNWSLGADTHLELIDGVDGAAVNGGFGDSATDAGLHQLRLEGGGSADGFGAGARWTHRRTLDGHQVETSADAAVQTEDGATYRARAAVAHTDGDDSDAGEATVTTDGTDADVEAAYEHKRGQDRTKVVAGAATGPEASGKLETELDRDGFELRTGLRVGRDQTSDGERLSGEGDATLQLDTPKPGETVTLTVRGRGSSTELESGRRRTGGADAEFGGFGSRAKVVYDYQDDTAGGFQIHDFRIEGGHDLHLDEALEEELSLMVIGTGQVSTAPGDVSEWSATLTGKWVRGEGAGRRELLVKLFGGRGAIDDATGAVLPGGSALAPEPAVDESGTTIEQESAYGGVAAEAKVGDHEFGAEFAMGRAGDRNLFRGKGCYALLDGEDTLLDAELVALIAESDDQVDAIVEATTRIAITSGITLTAGGSVTIKPSDPAFASLWNVYTRAGIELAPEHELELELGVDGEGDQIAYVAEAAYAWRGKLDASLKARFGDDELAAALGLGGGGAELVVGYGDLTTLDVPGAGPDVLEEVGGGWTFLLKADLIEMLGLGSD